MTAPSSLKSLTLWHPKCVSSLSNLKANTCLTCVHIIIEHLDQQLATLVADVLKSNRTLEELFLNTVHPDDEKENHDIRKITTALIENTTLKILKLVFFSPKVKKALMPTCSDSESDEECYHDEYDKSAIKDCVRGIYPEINTDRRIEFSLTDYSSRSH